MEFATGALGTLLPKLSKLLQDEYNLQRSAKKNIEFLMIDLKSMGTALRLVGEVPPEDLNEMVKIWAQDVRELSYDMEDAIDTFLVRVEGPEPQSRNSSKRFVRKMIKLVTKGKIRHQIAQDIEDIKERVKEVAERHDRLTAMYNNATNLVGLDEAKEDLIMMMTRGEGIFAQQQKTISIVGIGGLGKTTLAQVVYDKLKAEFDCTAFVSVSQNPDINKVFKNILYELNKARYGNIHSTFMEGTQLIDLVREFLKNKRHFIVIDDMWDIATWEIIKCALIENNMRSRIIVTTRIICVGKEAGYCYKLKPLTHESSKMLFYGRIFSSEDKCPRQFSEVSEKILNKCGGVPLAIITTSSLLVHKLGNIEEWNDLCDSLGSGLGGSHDMENMRKILSLSYYNLPYYLKNPLLYLGIFPEDSDIERDRLIWRWIAEDFVQHRDGGQSLFEIGQSYFNELLNRSLIQPVNIVDDDIPLRCRVHDMVLDLVCSLSREEYFFTTISGDDTKQTTLSLGSKVRRLSLHTTAWPTINMPKLRSLTIFSQGFTISMPSSASYHLLCVLDLEDCKLMGEPSLKFVGNLLNLRYLGLRYSRYDAELPVEIQKLQFLQTLNIEGCYVKELPSCFSQLRQLLSICVEPSTRLPNGLRNLTLLEVVGVAGVDSAYTAEELGHLTQLRLLYVHFQKDKEGRWDEIMCKSFIESLGNLHKVQNLGISFEVAVDLDGSVQYLGNLHRLIIYNGSSIPTWISPEVLPILSILRLTVNQVRMTDIQALGMLPALHSLEVMCPNSDIQIKERFMVSTDAFPCTRVCKFLRFATVPSMFPRGAMPKLEQFDFDFRLEDFSTNDFEDMALGHLPSLQSVSVGIDRKSRGNEEALKKVEEVLRHQAEIHPNHPNIHIGSMR